MRGSSLLVAPAVVFLPLMLAESAAMAVMAAAAAGEVTGAVECGVRAQEFQEEAKGTVAAAMAVEAAGAGATGVEAAEAEVMVAWARDAGARKQAVQTVVAAAAEAMMGAATAASRVDAKATGAVTEAQMAEAGLAAATAAAAAVAETQAVARRRIRGTRRTRWLRPTSTGLPMPRHSRRTSPCKGATDAAGAWVLLVAVSLGLLPPRRRSLRPAVAASEEGREARRVRLRQRAAMTTVAEASSTAAVATRRAAASSGRLARAAAAVRVEATAARAAVWAEEVQAVVSPVAPVARDSTRALLSRSRVRPDRSWPRRSGRQSTSP